MRFNRKKEPANGGTNDTAGQFSFNSFFDLLNGNFATYQEEQTLNNVYDRERDYALYAQDTWKLTPHLTLDLGLRYQILAQIFSATNNISNFRPSAYDASVCTAADFDANGNVDPICATNGIVTPKTPGVGRSTLPTTTATSSRASVSPGSLKRSRISSYALVLASSLDATRFLKPALWARNCPTTSSPTSPACRLDNWAHSIRLRRNHQLAYLRSALRT